MRSHGARGFNPLFIGALRSTKGSDTKSHRRIAKFQSPIHRGTSVICRAAGACKQEDADRFNPLFIGALRSSRVVPRRIHTRLFPWFQSPIHRGTSINEHGRDCVILAGKIRFNPLFIGALRSTPGRGAQISVHVYRFNPLFIGALRSSRINLMECLNCQCRKFQSPIHRGTSINPLDAPH